MAEVRLPEKSTPFLKARTQQLEAKRFMTEKPYHIVIDFETANNSPTSACSIGMVVLEEYRIIHEAVFLIKPPTDEFLHTAIHGITWEQVKREKRFDEVWRTGIKPWYDKSKLLVAHNVGFDQKVLHSTAMHYNIKIPRRKTECTVKLSRYQLGIQPANLANVSQTLGIKLNHHEALSDARASAMIYIFAKTGEKPWVEPKPDNQIEFEFETEVASKETVRPPLETLDLDRALKLNSEKSAALLKDLLSKKSKSIKMEP